MNRIGRQIILFIFILAFFCTATAYANLPDLPRQELWVKLISLAVGLVVIFALSVLGVSRLFLWVLRLEADLATNLAIVVGIIFSFLWFLYIFGQIFDMVIKIAIGVLLFVAILIIFLREKEKPTESGSGDSGYNGMRY